MKKEEMKQLTEGQTVYVAVKYLGNATDGESAHVKIPTTDWIDMGNHNVISIGVNVSFEHIVIPSPVKENKPKYDPCRLFKKGDKATPRIVNGRKPVCGIDGVAAKINSVELIVESNEGERENGTVDIKFPCGTIGQIDPVYLELVTPVEELEPYSVHESEVIQGFDIVRDKLCVMTFPFGAKECGWYYNRLAAKEAAEAERDRLNAEWRKEQNNG